MDKLESMRAFVAVVSHSGFAAAGRHLGMSRSAMNKLVAQLEADLGVQLLQRTTRRVSPTDTGRAYYERCVDILAEVAAADVAVSQLQAEAKGTLRINAPMSFGTMHLGRAIAHFMRHYPDIKIQLSLTDRFVDLIEEGFDVTLRIAEIKSDESLIMQEITPIRRVLCASPDYLEAKGVPTHPDELNGHDCLQYGHFSTDSPWHLFDTEGRAFSANPHCRSCSNNGEVLREGAIAGTGIALLPTFMISEALRSGELSIVMADYAPTLLTAYLNYATNRHLSTKIQLLTTFLKDWFKHPTWEKL
jgi:DNA-binding transcriptional LysR family regulator